MWRMIASLYARRVVNVNVNILVAGVLALGPVLLIVKVYHRLGLDPRWLPLVTFTADVVADVLFYYILHFLANHLGRPILGMTRRPELPATETKAAATIHTIADATVEHVPFFKDATKVQIQRALLSPLLYALWLGTQWFLVHVEEWHPVPATALGFGVGVGAARVLHTVWMLWDERKARRDRAARAAQAAAANAGRFADAAKTPGPNGPANAHPPTPSRSATPV